MRISYSHSSQRVYVLACGRSCIKALKATSSHSFRYGDFFYSSVCFDKKYSISTILVFAKVNIIDVNDIDFSNVAVYNKDTVAKSHAENDCNGHRIDDNNKYNVM